MAEKFDPAHWERLEDPQRLVELPPDVIAELLDVHGHETVVDFGAGTGAFTIPLAEHLACGLVLAVDESPELLGRLRDKLTTIDPLQAARIEPVLTEDGQVPLDDGIADRLLTINVAHHVHDEPQALAAMARLLRPGGRLVVIDFGDIDRPIGPPRDHVLPHDRLRELIRGLGVREIAVYEPGELLQHHIAVVAEKPADT